jgi:hypothetical protein
MLGPNWACAEFLYAHDSCNTYGTLIGADTAAPRAFGRDELKSACVLESHPIFWITEREYRPATAKDM